MKARSLTSGDLTTSVGRGVHAAWQDGLRAVAQGDALADRAIAIAGSRTNVYRMDVSSADPLGYRLSVLHGPIDLKMGSPVVGEYPDQEYARAIALHYAAVKDSGRPAFHAISATVQGHAAVYERVILPLFDGDHVTECLATSTVLLATPKLADADAPNSRLTEREYQVVEALASDMALKQVAEHLGLSIKTVEKHVSSVKTKTGARTLYAAVARVLAESLV